jgi:hypothetical protein
MRGSVTTTTTNSKGKTDFQSIPLIDNWQKQRNYMWARIAVVFGSKVNQ